jgi:hypothetical protein
MLLSSCLTSLCSWSSDTLKVVIAFHTRWLTSYSFLACLSSEIPASISLPTIESMLFKDSYSPIKRSCFSSSFPISLEMMTASSAISFSGMVASGHWLYLHASVSIMKSFTCSMSLLSPSYIPLLIPIFSYYLTL